jgi:hypothetical protein
MVQRKAQGTHGGYLMPTTTALPFLPGRRALRRYSDGLAARIAAEPAIRLLDRLLSLPLDVPPLPDPVATLALGRAIALCGPPAGGRTLALLQTAARWTTEGGDAPVLYLPLTEHDAPNLSPRAIIANTIHRAGLPAAYAEGGRSGLLLIDDWELLSADRRALWQSFLWSASERWTAFRVVAALPPETEWPGFMPITVAPPNAEQPGTWLAHLLPDQDCATILAALNHEPLAFLRTSLADLVLLALVYPLSGLPESRARLYEQAYALVRPLLDDERSWTTVDGADTAAEHNAELDAASPPAGVGPVSTVHIGRALLRHYRLARGLAGGADLVTLSDLAAAERVAVAPLAAGLLDDPTPVIESLWAADDDPANLRALAACTREAPARTPGLGLRLVERLAMPDASPESQALLHSLSPVLPALLKAASRFDETRAAAALPTLAAALPAAYEPWLRLCDDVQVPPVLRWAAADCLANAPPEVAELIAVVADAPPEVLVPRVYIAAVSGPEGRAALAASTLRAGLMALFLDPHAGERRATVARALVHDPHVPEAIQSLALGHVADSEVVERAAGTGSPMLRRAALSALAVDPDDALVALRRTLAQPEASTPARYEILDTIATLPRPDATGVLARVALDPALPLTTRLHATDLLSGRGGSSILLRRMLITDRLPLALRCAAAGHLGRLGVGEALPDLAALLAAPNEPLLRRVAATALGALAQRPRLSERAASALVAGMRRAATDVTVGERIIRALGTSGAPTALPTLTSLLAPGLTELIKATWLRNAPLLERTPAFAWPGLDLALPIRLALLDALADGGTLADPPSRLTELAVRHTTRLAVAAARALADLAVRPSLRNGALTALRGAACDSKRPELARAALEALVQIGDPAGELATILDGPGVSSETRWLAVEVLATDSAALELLRRRLERTADEPFCGRL